MHVNIFIWAAAEYITMSENFRNICQGVENTCAIVLCLLHRSVIVMHLVLLTLCTGTLTKLHFWEITLRSSLKLSFSHTWVMTVHYTSVALLSILFTHIYRNIIYLYHYKYCISTDTLTPDTNDPTAHPTLHTVVGQMAFGGFQWFTNSVLAAWRADHVEMWRAVK